MGGFAGIAGKIGGAIKAVDASDAKAMGAKAMGAKDEGGEKKSTEAKLVDSIKSRMAKRSASKPDLGKD